jgi:serine/threonine-protein kinase HipA
MQRIAEVYLNDLLAGHLKKNDEGYSFVYADLYLSDPQNPSISLTIPKNIKEHYSKTLFAFFFGLLSEGDLKTIQCRNLGIDENDHFSRLVKTGFNTIGAVHIKEVVNE